MNFKRLLVFNMSLFFASVIVAKNSAFIDTSVTNKGKLIIVGGGIGVALVGSYWYVQESWWSDNQKKFHFDEGSDLTYALNVDKLGHFLGGVGSSEVFASSLAWAGTNKNTAVWCGAFFGTGLQLGIEMKDAYAPHWGFSKWDFALGTAGSFWPVAQHYYPTLKAVGFKFSYYKRSDIYWQLDLERGKENNRNDWHNDYPNQTYWMTLDINDFIQTCCWPDWLNVAIGFGLDDSQYLNRHNTKTGGKNEWYIALDYDVQKVLKKWDSRAAKKIKKWLNYFHFPSPTIKISPQLEFYPLFI